MIDMNNAQADTEQADELVIAPDNLNAADADVILTDFAPPRLSRRVKKETEEVSLERFRSGYRLVRIVLYVIAGVYFIGMTYGMFMTLSSQPTEMDIKDFSLEVIRLLIPPLTFVLGFLFGAKEQE